VRVFPSGLNARSRRRSTAGTSRWPAIEPVFCCCTSSSFFGLEPGSHNSTPPRFGADQSSQTGTSCLLHPPDASVLPSGENASAYTVAGNRLQAGPRRRRLDVHVPQGHAADRQRLASPGKRRRREGGMAANTKLRSETPGAPVACIEEKRPGFPRPPRAVCRWLKTRQSIIPNPSGD